MPGSLVVLGGNKSLLFNAEYLISIASQVRFVLFYDAGQVRDVGQSFAWKEDLTQLVFPPDATADRRAGVSSLTPLDAPGVTTRVIGQDERVQDVDRRRAALLHAGAERAVPVDLRVEPAARRRARQQPAAAEGEDLPVRGRNDVLANVAQKCVTVMV